jgi:hypothetical protein
MTVIIGVDPHKASHTGLALVLAESMAVGVEEYRLLLAVDARYLRLEPDHERRGGNHEAGRIFAGRGMEPLCARRPVNQPTRLVAHNRRALRRRAPRRTTCPP